MLQFGLVITVGSKGVLVRFVDSLRTRIASYGSCITCAVMISSGSKGKVFANEEVQI